MSTTIPLAGSEWLPAPGSRVPNCTTGMIGAPVTMARYAAPVWNRSNSPEPRRPSGKIPRTLPLRSTRRQRFTARGSGLNRSSGIWPAPSRNPFMKPLNISCLVSACTGRGAKIASSGPSATPTWLLARMTPPFLGSFWPSVTRTPTRRRITNRASGRSG